MHPPEEGVVIGVGLRAMRTIRSTTDLVGDWKLAIPVAGALEA